MFGMDIVEVSKKKFTTLSSKNHDEMEKII